MGCSACGSRSAAASTAAAAGSTMRFDRKPKAPSCCRSRSDLIALVGRLRYVTRASVPEIHAELVRRGVMISERSVTNLLDRYDELVATAMTDPGHLRARFADQGRVVLAIDGLQ